MAGGALQNLSSSPLTVRTMPLSSPSSSSSSLSSSSSSSHSVSIGLGGGGGREACSSSFSRDVVARGRGEESGLSLLSSSSPSDQSSKSRSQPPFSSPYGRCRCITDFEIKEAIGEGTYGQSSGSSVSLAPAISLYIHLYRDFLFAPPASVLSAPSVFSLHGGSSLSPV